MAGRLTTHPYVKTYDELQRSITRMEAHLEMHGLELTADESHNIASLIEMLEKAVTFIPENYRITRYKSKRDGA